MKNCYNIIVKELTIIIYLFSHVSPKKQKVRIKSGGIITEKKYVDLNHEIFISCRALY